MKAIMAIQRDPTLTDAEKGTRRQLLMSGKWAPTAEEKTEEAGERGARTWRGGGTSISQPQPPGVPLDYSQEAPGPRGAAAPPA